MMIRPQLASNALLIASPAVAMVSRVDRQTHNAQVWWHCAKSPRWSAKPSGLRVRHHDLDGAWSQVLSRQALKADSEPLEDL